MGMACSVCGDKSSRRKQKFSPADLLCFDDDAVFEMRRYSPSVKCKRDTTEERDVHQDHVMLEMKPSNEDKYFYTKGEHQSNRSLIPGEEAMERKGQNSLVYLAQKGPQLEKGMAITETHYSTMTYRDEVKVEPNAICHTREKVSVAAMNV